MIASDAHLSPPLRLAPMQPAHTSMSARLHRELLPHGLFPRLGQRFMRRWHRTFVDSPHGVALGVMDEQGVLRGFLIATVDQAGYTRDVLESARWALGWRGAIALAARPRLAAQFVRTRSRRYLRRLRPGAARDQPGPEATPSRVGVLHAVACAPSARGNGVGTALLAEFVRLATEAETPLLQLVTRDSGGAADFYRRHGWVVTDQRLDRDGNAIVQLDHKPGIP